MADSPLEPILTTEGWELLNSLPPYEKAHSLALNQRLRKEGHSADLVAAALTQSQLRAQARRKFGDFASRMLLTYDGLQQATRLPVAARHARRFRKAGLTHIADLGCGLGADALAFASAGMQVMAIEADETTAAAATMNLLPFPEARVLHTTAEAFAAKHGLLQDTWGHSTSACAADSAEEGPQSDPKLPQGWGLWLDPARRDTGGARSARGAASRLWDPEAFSPPLSFVTALAETGIPLGVKLGPGIPHGLIPADCEAEWVSIDGDLVEVVLWFNVLARPGVRRAATVLTTEESTPGPPGTPNTRQDTQVQALAVRSAELTVTTDFGPGTPPHPTGRQGLHGILHEPDPAVIRAGLVAELCEDLGGRMLDEHIAYFCTDDTPKPATEPSTSPPGDSSARPFAEASSSASPDTAHQKATSQPALSQRSPLARGYRVLEVMDFSTKTLRRWAAESAVTSVEIKKRGVDVVPETLRKQILSKIKPKGRKRHAVLVITRIGEDHVVAVVEPTSRSA